MKDIALDSNLLVLLVVGLTDRGLICQHRRTKQFEAGDLDLLLGLIRGYERILVTPHVLTEVSNLAFQIAGPAREAIRGRLASMISTQTEKYESSAMLTQHSCFVRLGLTDCALLTLIGRNIPLLTTDLDLYLEAARTNSAAVNFNHLRQGRMLEA